MQKNIIVFLDFIPKNKTTEFLNQWFFGYYFFFGLQHAIVVILIASVGGKK